MPYEPVTWSAIPEQNVAIDEKAPMDEAELDLMLAHIDAGAGMTGPSTTPEFHLRRIATRLRSLPADDPYRRQAVRYLALRAVEHAVVDVHDQFRWLWHNLGAERGAADHMFVHGDTLHLTADSLSSESRRRPRRRNADATARALCGHAVKQNGGQLRRVLRGAWQSGRYQACIGCAERAHLVDEAAERPDDGFWSDQRRDDIAFDAAERAADRFDDRLHQFSVHGHTSPVEEAARVVAEGYAQQAAEVLSRDPERTLRLLIDMSLRELVDKGVVDHWAGTASRPSRARSAVRRRGAA